jgi:hypothetical protein
MSRVEGLDQAGNGELTNQFLIIKHHINQSNSNSQATGRVLLLQFLSFYKPNVAV